MKLHITGLSHCGATRTAIKNLTKDSITMIMCADNNVEYVTGLIKDIHLGADSGTIIRNTTTVSTRDFELAKINLDWAIHNRAINTIVLDSIQNYGFDNAKLLNAIVDEAVENGSRKTFIITEHVRMKFNFDPLKEGTCAL